MIRPKMPFFLSIFLLGCSVVGLFAQEPDHRVTLKQAIDQSRSHPSVQARNWALESAKASRDLIHGQLTKPTVQVQGSYNSRSESFSIDTPIGSFEMGDRTGYQVEATAVQPLYSPGGRGQRLPAADEDVISFRHSYEQAAQDQAQTVAQTFFNLLETESRIEVLERYIANLERRHRETVSMVELGRLLHTDSLKVEIAHEEARFQLFQLEESRGVLTLQLGFLINESGPVQPRWNLDSALPKLPDAPDPLDAQSLNARNDLQALNRRAHSLKLQAKATAKEALPRVDGIVRYSHSDGEAFGLDSLFEARLQVKWSPFEAGTRSKRIAKLKAEERALVSQKNALESALNLGLTAAYSELKTAQRAIDLARRNVDLADETLRVERERYLKQRTTANDLLESELAVFEQESNFTLAQIQYLRSYFNFNYAKGRIWTGG